MPKMSTGQSSTHEKGRRTSPVEKSSRTIAGNQYQYCWIITKI